MAFIIFNDDHKVGFKRIDSEHRKIASLTNKIYNAAVKNEEEKFHSSFSDFLQLLDLHFKNEERLMKENGFSGYFTHKLEHERFYGKISSLNKRKRGKGKLIDPGELESVRRWFYNHIEINDRKCGEFLIKKGVKN